METTENLTQKLLDNAIILRVEFGRFGTSRQQRCATLVVDGAPANRDRITPVKKTLLSDTLDAIAQLDTALRGELTKRCLPGFVGGAASGMWVLPLAQLDVIDAQLQAHVAARTSLVDTFVAEYPAAVMESKAALGDHFDPSDYVGVTLSDDGDTLAINPAGVAAKFRFSYQYVTFSTPDNLKSANKFIYQREVEKARAAAVSQVENLMYCLRLKAFRVAKAMADRLKPAADGKRRVFRDSSIDGAKEFLAGCKTLNLLDDTALQAEIDALEKMMDGVDAAALRTDSGLRERVQAVFATAEQNLGALMKNAPTRFIALDDDTEAA